MTLKLKLIQCLIQVWYSVNQLDRTVKVVFFIIVDSLVIELSIDQLEERLNKTEHLLAGALSRIDVLENKIISLHETTKVTDSDHQQLKVPPNKALSSPNFDTALDDNFDEFNNAPLPLPLEAE